jgi:hypothetical protein
MRFTKCLAATFVLFTVIYVTAVSRPGLEEVKPFDDPGDARPTGQWAPRNLKVVRDSSPIERPSLAAGAETASDAHQPEEPVPEAETIAEAPAADPRSPSISLTRDALSLSLARNVPAQQMLDLLGRSGCSLVILRLEAFTVRDVLLLDSMTAARRLSAAQWESFRRSHSIDRCYWFRWVDRDAVIWQVAREISEAHAVPLRAYDIFLVVGGDLSAAILQKIQEAVEQEAVPLQRVAGVNVLLGPADNHLGAEVTNLMFETDLKEQVGEGR